ncbi:MAG: YafY family protein, partial [Pseudomonadota bacterium]
SGVPIEGEAGYGYVLEDGYDLPPLMFTRSEIAALVAGARMVKAWGGFEMARGAEEALAKIDSVLDEGLRARARGLEVHSFGLEIDDATREALDVIKGAVDASVRLSFDYRDAAGSGSRRVIRPLGLWFWGRVWTCVAWWELRDDFRTFRVDRMAGIERGEIFRQGRGQTLRDFYTRQDEIGARINRT